jgi:hypothetical protein
MADMTPKGRLDAIRDGLEESALLVALGYEAAQGRPNIHRLNDALELWGYGRPIPDWGPERPPYRTLPDGWLAAVAEAVTGRPDAPVREVIAALKRDMAFASAQRASRFETLRRRARAVSGTDDIMALTRGEE